MKNILVVEDDEERVKVFKRHLNSAGELFLASNFDEAANILHSGIKMDVTFLDHDLEEEHYTGYGELLPGTGQDVARCIASLPREKRPQCCVVHSLNPDGALAIIGILDDADIESLWRWPFNPDTFPPMLTRLRKWL